MKRTYVDIIGEYYDHKNDLIDEASHFGLRDADLKKVYRYRTSQKKVRISEQR